MVLVIDPHLAVADVVVNSVVDRTIRACWFVHTVMMDLNDTGSTGFAMIRYFGCSSTVNSDSGMVNLVR